MGNWTAGELAADYKAGRVSRRQVIKILLSAGIGMPLISSFLAACGGSNNNKASTAATSAATKAAAAATSGGAAPAASPTKAAGASATSAAAADAFKPAKRGGGGVLKLFWWQSPTILNPHLSPGTKDSDGSRLFYEPLAAFDPDGNLTPILAAEVPSVDKGTVDKAGKFVIWKLKKGVTWHDGQPFTADDVVFTWQYASNADTTANTAGVYQVIESVEKVDDLTAKVTFKAPTLSWNIPFVGANGMIIPKHVFAAAVGKDARNAPANIKPVGTGAYKLTDFQPNDHVLADINPNYHVDNRPFFDKIEMKGGGDAVGAARAVLESGEYDYAWNLQVEANQLTQLAKGSQAQVLTWNGGSIEHINLNFSDPNKEVDGEKSSLKAPHPFLTDLKVRQALALAADRKTVVEQLYGPTGAVPEYYAYAPKKYSGSAKWALDTAKANQLLDDAGWKKGGDGVRTKGGVRMHVLYTTSINALRQNEQAIVKKNLEGLGVEVELKSVDAGVYFGDPTNPDSIGAFTADLEMYTSTRSQPDDLDTFLRKFVSTEVAQKANNWALQNYGRYVNPAFDKLYLQAKSELDPVKAVDLYKQMNQLIIDDAVVIPLVGRNNVAAGKKNLQGLFSSGWDSDLWWLPYWHRA